MGSYSLEFPTGLTASNESPEAAAFWELEEETGNEGDVTECSLAYGSKFVSSTTYIVAITVNGDDAENVKPKPKPEDREFVENDLLKRFDAKVTEEHLTVDVTVFSYALALKHANMKLFEVPFLKFYVQRAVAMFL
eukprot:bmy_16765T0